MAVASGKRSCDSRLQAGGSNTPNGATPRLSFPRPPTSACYAYILTQSRGIIDQHNFKWLKTNGREIWGFVRLLYFLLFFFFCFPVEIRVIGSDFPEVKPVIRFLFLLLCGCWQSPEVPPHTHSTTRTLQTLTSPVTPEDFTDS